jgi:carbon monoxide dehydrogenase subunit G
MIKLESRIGKIHNTEEKIYNFLSDFNNFKDLIPEDKIKNWESSADSCRFTIDSIGEAGMQIVEKQPYGLIKVASKVNNKIEFNFWIQLKQTGEKDTRIKLTIKADVNPMLRMIVKKPLQTFLDSIIDRLEKLKF